jgi:rRNA maturation endonuclease Nob1
MNVSFNTNMNNFVNVTPYTKKEEDTQLSQKEADIHSKKDNTEEKAQKTYDELTTQEKRVVNELQARDTEVRAHEAAHEAAGGGLAGGASFSYEKGPDGKMYAVAGEVPISFKEGKTPQETIANARQVKAAALAPANPSPQDYAIANSATMMELKAQQQLQKEKLAQDQGFKQYALHSF